MGDTNLLLQITNLHSYYGEGHILKGINLEIREKELVTLLGRNGAGKTTLIKSIMGIVLPKDGAVLFQGRNIVGIRPNIIARLGIGFVPEDRRIFPSLTVLENLNLPLIKKREEGWSLSKIYEYFPRLKEREMHKGSELSGGEQQMLAIARILRTKASLILMDEPTEGLAPMLIRNIETILRGIKKEGITLLLVEQNTRFAEAVGERFYIIANGEIVYVGPREEFALNNEVKKKYLGI